MCVETGSLWEISATSSQFCCEPTTALKSRGGRKAQEGGATYKYIYIYGYDDSQCCTAETNTTL